MIAAPEPLLGPTHFVGIDDRMKTRTVADINHHTNTKKIMSMKIEIQIHFVSYMLYHIWYAMR